VFDGAALVRYGPDLREAGRIAVPPGDLATLVATPSRVLLQRGIGSDLAVDADTLATTEVALPDGRPVASGDAVWFHDDGPVLRRLGPDGTVATAPNLDVDGSLVGDGLGGAWFRGGIHTEWGDGTANPLMVDALGRTVAVHLDDRGSVDRTISATAGPTGGVYFDPVARHVIATWSGGYGLVEG
jgi:hypothetical protein